MIEYTLITGATSGIGLELARIYASKAKNLLLIARNEQKLKEIARQLSEKYQIQIHYLSVDLAKPNSAKKVVKWTRENFYEVGTLINNAGFGSFGEFHKSNIKNEMEMIELNVVSLVYLTRAYLPRMIFRGKGGILNVASIASFLAGGPRMVNYYATKAYVLSFTQGLAAELKKTKIKIAALCPGATITGFQDRPGMERYNKRLAKLGNFSLTAKEVAQYGYEEFEKGKVVIIPGNMVKVSAFLARKMPMGVIRNIMCLIQK